MGLITPGLSIKLPKELETPVYRKDILLSFYKLIGNDISKIEFISQQQNNYTWFITFEKDFNHQHLIGRQLSINDFQINIEDAVESSKYRVFTFRVF